MHFSPESRLIVIGSVVDTPLEELGREYATLVRKADKLSQSWLKSVWFVGKYQKRRLERVRQRSEACWSQILVKYQGVLVEALRAAVRTVGKNEQEEFYRYVSARLQSRLAKGAGEEPFSQLIWVTVQERLSFSKAVATRLARKFHLRALLDGMARSEARRMVLHYAYSGAVIPGSGPQPVLEEELDLVQTGCRQIAEYLMSLPDLERRSAGSLSRGDVSADAVAGWLFDARFV